MAQLEEKWLRKLIRNCFLQYGYDNESLPLNNEEWKQLCAKILAKKTDDGDMDLYEIVHDVIYDYITK
ncbi:YqzH family protein [Saccharococcus caldoxylosilyticus]|uniref:YqzH family protein n=1 Tax=Saccharococcus caldoxylosilyticus TaxID=81408 RepID=UPI001FCC46A5|nr:YqzH family protein [Parageobacillus caldoxylosilyticus]